MTITRTNSERECEQTYQDWYKKHRCRGSPHDSRPCLALGYKIWTDFAGFINQDELEQHILGVLQDSFRYFDRQRGKKNSSVSNRFLKCFAVWLRRRFRRLRRQARRHRRYWRLKDDQFWKKAPGFDQDERRHAHRFMEWARFLFAKVLGRIDPKACQLIKRRYLDGQKPAAIASQTGLSSRTISRYTSRKVLVRKFQKEVSKMVLSIPDATLDKIIYVLHYQEGFTEREIARLFCISVACVERILLRTAGTIMAGLEGADGMKLFAEAAG